MEWSKEEKQALFGVNACGSEKDVLTIASKAAELMAARGGTMTADEIQQLTTSSWVRRIRQHVASQGARIAALETERNTLAVETRMLRAANEATRQRSLDTNSLERITAEHGLPTAMRWVVDGESHTLLEGLKVYDEAHADMRRQQAIDASELFPCSPTCTHPDAATPGHPEWMKERSEAFKTMHPTGSCTCAGEGTCAWCDKVATSAERAGYDEGLSKGWDDGAEAMRAACWEAVQEYLDRSGLSASSPALGEHLKSAIANAKP